MKENKVPWYDSSLSLSSRLKWATSVQREERCPQFIVDRIKELLEAYDTKCEHLKGWQDALIEEIRSGDES